MRFLPINQENVSNAATLYVKIQNIPPLNMNWTYSAAYARLSAEIKNVGFDGYITFGETGYPIGFAMGHSEVREDGKSNFILRELCFESNKEGRNAAVATLVRLVETLNLRGIDTLVAMSESNSELEKLFNELGFAPCENIVCFQKKLN